MGAVGLTEQVLEGHLTNLKTHNQMVYQLRKDTSPRNGDTELAIMRLDAVQKSTQKMLRNATRLFWTRSEENSGAGANSQHSNFTPVNVTNGHMKPHQSSCHPEPLNSSPSKPHISSTITPSDQAKMASQKEPTGPKYQTVPSNNDGDKSMKTSQETTPTKSTTSHAKPPNPNLTPPPKSDPSDNSLKRHREEDDNPQSVQQKKLRPTEDVLSPEKRKSPRHADGTEERQSKRQKDWVETEEMKAMKKLPPFSKRKSPMHETEGEERIWKRNKTHGDRPVPRPTIMKRKASMNYEFPHEPLTKKIRYDSDEDEEDHEDYGDDDSYVPCIEFEDITLQVEEAIRERDAQHAADKIRLQNTEKKRNRNNPNTSDEEISEQSRLDRKKVKFESDKGFQKV